MTDFDILAVCYICDKFIRDTTLPVVGKPVVLSCGCVFHSVCVPNDLETCPKCDEVVEMVTSVKVSKEELEVSENWNELVNTVAEMMKSI